MLEPRRPGGPRTEAGERIVTEHEGEVEDRGERLQKILSRAGLASRRAAEELIRAGRVTVNGKRAVLGERVDLLRDAVKVDGKRVRLPEVHRYLLLNKPKGLLCTVSDPEGRATVLDLVPTRLRKGLFPVGRLDYQTEGLLLLTNDGELAHLVAHPRYGCTKTYEVKVKGRPDELTVDRLRGGLVLAGRKTAPCKIRPHRPSRQGREGANSWWTVELREGRTRQVREMFFRVGHPVQRLRRVAIGTLSDRTLPAGACRELTEREVELLKRSTKVTRG